MRCFTNSINFLFLLYLVVLSSCKKSYSNLEDGLYAEIKTSKGDMVAKLAYKKVPVTVANFVSLAEGTNTLVDSIYLQKKFYNGLTFHRVIDSFMIQGGDPLANGRGNPGYRFKNEFHPDLNHNKPGILAMANGGPNTNGSQFYITEVPRPDLNNHYSVFGELVVGTNIQDSISNVKTDAKDKPLEEVIIEEINIIRKGKDAENFNAPKIFKNHFIQEIRKEKKRKERAKAIIRDTKEKFIEQQEEATTLPSGLQYFVSKSGKGEKLSENAVVKTHYTVYFSSGKLIQTSSLEKAKALEAVNEKRLSANGYQPIHADISPDADMIPGFKEGLQQLHVGDKATLFIPYHLAYGEAGNRGIPPKTDLVFEVEILEIVK
ncbi:peptidylprolyl isomerase [Seonamhaeicola aphaedonensis]|uniref:peptidylprolyl isomerase n=1 Tax=Seonamhaeicola aphaedonensis TaxID=1461338 RepID=A0A3D9HDL5_9FLAO|nr:peptidylprolyl isomerase [Seonamhaeicola aphaedonensis]RED47567.1 peptidylprolyl isomerase [Seonamhaeicola aphaedonensis]